MNKIIFFVSLILLVSCSQEQESMSNTLQTDDLTWDENGVGFAEFLGCTKGPDFARENLEENVMLKNLVIYLLIKKPLFSPYFLHFSYFLV